MGTRGRPPPLPITFIELAEVSTMPSTVLIITNDHDEHADAVIGELTKRDVAVFRFHPVDFPHACSVSLEIDDGRIAGRLRTGDHQVDFDDICAAWYRRSRNLYTG